MLFLVSFVDLLDLTRLVLALKMRRPSQTLCYLEQHHEFD